MITANMTGYDRENLTIFARTFRETLEELKQFEDILYSITEYSDTYLDPIQRI